MMTTYTTPLALAQKLVSLPSYVSDTQDETSVTDFLIEFLKKALPTMTVERQYLSDSKRCNLILCGKNSPKLFVLGHIDTVQPKDGWQTDPFDPIIKDDKLYGLGASDMKSSLAAFLWILIREQQAISLDDLMLLMYVDEEYDFKGIKRFLINKTTSTIQPELTLSLDGELAVATGCRGLIEISFTARGKSGHSSNPGNGTNAITETLAVLQDVSQELASFTDTHLGQTTTNIAYIQGGVLQKTTEDEKWLREGNVIPDTAEVIFEIRPATTEVDARSVLRKIRQSMRQRHLIIEAVVIRHDIALWPVNYDQNSLSLLQKVYTVAKVPFRQSNRRLQGYIDAQMVTEKIPAPTFIIGTGGTNKHGTNENVSLENIEQAARIYSALLREVLT